MPPRGCGPKGLPILRRTILSPHSGKRFLIIACCGLEGGRPRTGKTRHYWPAQGNRPGTMGLRLVGGIIGCAWCYRRAKVPDKPLLNDNGYSVHPRPGAQNYSSASRLVFAQWTGRTTAVALWLRSQGANKYFRFSKPLRLPEGTLIAGHWGACALLFETQIYNGFHGKP